MAGKVPSVEEFLRFYKGKEYYRALGLKEDAVRGDILDAVDEFQLEHCQRQSEWEFPLTEVKNVLLERLDAEQKPMAKKPTRLVDPRIQMQVKRMMVDAYERYEKKGLLREAFGAYGKCIELDPGYTEAYARRAWVGLLFTNYRPYLDQVIADCTKVIEAEPENAYIRNDRGRAYFRKGDMENACINYREALSYCPSLTIAALNLMEINICLGRYKDAIGTYGEWRPDVVSEKEKLIAESLLCTACALDGKDYKNHMNCLNNMRITIRNMDDWCADVVEKHLDNLKKQGFDRGKLAKAADIHQLFKRHFR